MPVLLDDGTQKYVYGAGGLAYTVNKSTAAVQMYHTDGLGSVRAITDGSGSVTQTYQTDEFGIPIAAGTQGTNSQPLAYTGEQRDSENGLVYLRARMYDPSVGRFIQADPLRKSGAGVAGWNRYTYVANNPLRYIDPSGHGMAQNRVLATIVINPCIVNDPDFGCITIIDLLVLAVSGSGGLNLPDSVNSTAAGGKLSVQGGSYSQSEFNVANELSNRGNDVTLRQPSSTRSSAGGTADLLVNGKSYDVYTPGPNTSASRIVSAVASKGDQAFGVVVDLTLSGVPEADLANILARVQGTGSRIQDVILLFGK